MTGLPWLPTAYRWRWHSLATFAVLEASCLERLDARLTLAGQRSGLLYAPAAPRKAAKAGGGRAREPRASLATPSERLR